VKEEVDGEEVNREVAEVPYNLGVLRETLGRIIEGRKALPDDVLQRQRIIEETAYESALARFKHEAELFKDMRMGGSLTSKNMKVWIWEWYTKTIPLLKERIAEIKEEESGGMCSICVTTTKAATEDQIAHKKKRPVTLKTHTLPVYSFLSLLQPEKLVIITILELMTMIGSNGYQGGIKTTRGLLTIGAAIEAEHHFQQAKKQNIPAIDFKSRADLPTYSVAGYLELHRERVKAKLEQEGTENWLPAWTPDLRVRVGAIVMDALMESATVTVTKSVEGEKLYVHLFRSYHFGKVIN
jgi:DNA-directed RNA polymerase